MFPLVPLLYVCFVVKKIKKNIINMTVILSHARMRARTYIHTRVIESYSISMLLFVEIGCG